MLGGLSYLLFHFVFIVPAIIVGMLLRRLEPGCDLPAQKTGIAVLALIALIYTTPWDNYLVAKKIWTYGEGRVLEHLVIGHVPLEEYLFFVLQPVMTGIFFLFYAARLGIGRREFARPLLRGRAAWVGAGLFGVFTLFGVLCLLALPQKLTYLGLILVWASPVLAFQWGYGGGTLWEQRRLLWRAVRTPTIYLWVVDMIAIEWKIWQILPETSTGVLLFSLPLEEAVFFLMTNLLVVQGLMLFFQFVSRQGWSLREGARNGIY